MRTATTPTPGPAPRCETCLHRRPAQDGGRYAQCVKVNVREGWGGLTFMPADPDDGCFRHEEPTDG